jgi:hypothetical protein
MDRFEMSWKCVWIMIIQSLMMIIMQYLICYMIHYKALLLVLLSILTRKKKDGRKAWLALLNQHAGQDCWDAEVKRENAFLTSHIWKGNGNVTLAKHAAKHRNSYISLETCALHVAYQLPNERTRVKYLLDSIRGCNDPGVQARIANIEGDYLPTGKRNTFEDSVTHLLPADPVNDNNKTCRSNGGGNQAAVSSVTIQSGKGKSGVNLRWHPMKEYKALSDDQQDELKDGRDSNEGKASIAASKKKYSDTKGSSPKKNKCGNDGNDRRVKFRKMNAVVVADTFKKKEEQAQINAITANMMSHMTLPPTPAPTVATVTTTPAVAAATSATSPSPNLIAARLVKMMGAADANASDR